MKWFFVVMLLIIWCFPVSGADYTTRDKYGRTIDTRDKYQDREVVRDSYGSTIETRDYDRGGVTARDQYGNTLWRRSK